MGKLFLLLMCVPSLVFAGVTNTQRIIFNAEVVASSCHAVIDADATGNNFLTFATYDRSVGTPVPARDFILRMYESGSSVPGCSAFRAGQFASIAFGNPGQLDASGVITHGAGDGVRIDVRATDQQASFHGRLVQGQAEIIYPTDFATKGQFRFQAKPVNLPQARAGEYYGALAFVVTYQ